MKRILLTIAYDGTNYSGWQKQKDEAVITVEGELTKALRLLFRNPALECIGASRTDAGVHAMGQRAVIDVDTSIPAEKIPLAMRRCACVSTPERWQWSPSRETLSGRIASAFSPQLSASFSSAGPAGKGRPRATPTRSTN